MKHVSEMTPEEQAEALRILKRGPPPAPVETTKRASEMSEVERRDYLAEHKRRFGV
jgi:hypothetical protein